MIHLAKYAAKATLLVRGESLEKAMSDYLVRDIRQRPNVEIRLRTELVEGEGGTALERITLHDLATGRRETVEAGIVYVLIGADPHTEWLAGTVERDGQGFILTGRHVPRDERFATPGRDPLSLETSMPGVFACGDVREGSVKRVSSAVGEGAVAVRYIHEYLAEPVALPRALPAVQVVATAGPASSPPQPHAPTLPT